MSRVYLILFFISPNLLSVFEIYPQSEIPRITQVACLDYFPSEDLAYLLPNAVLCGVFYEDRIVFRVVDFRTKYSASFSADVDVKRIGSKSDFEVFFILFKTLKLVSNYLLGRYSRRRQLLPSPVEKEY